MAKNAAACYPPEVRALARFVLLIGLGAAPARAKDEPFRWRELASPHFEVYHQGNWVPPGFVMKLERMHGRLRLDLAMFSPWIAKERVKLYLYADRRSYVAGRFEPPGWSNGVAMYEIRTVAVHDQPTAKKLLEVISHETTHLLFESYWGEVGKQPPSWLNEGLAMLEEAEGAERPETSDWYQLMVELPSKPMMTVESLATIRPADDLKNDKDKVALWYTQSYSVVHFLFRRHSKLQFKTFVSYLRDGRELKDALWLAYRYQTVERFEKAWLEWLKDPQHRARIARAYDSPSASLSLGENDKFRFRSMPGFGSVGSGANVRRKKEDEE